MNRVTHGLTPEERAFLPCAPWITESRAMKMRRVVAGFAVSFLIGLAFGYWVLG